MYGLSVSALLCCLSSTAMLGDNLASTALLLLLKHASVYTITSLRAQASDSHTTGWRKRSSLQLVGNVRDVTRVCC